MSKTKIEWCDYTVNPVKGLCPMACGYCYARRMYKRFKWNPEIRFDDSCLYGLPETPSQIFVGSTIELFGEWVKKRWLEHIFQTCALYPHHTFIFLTKQPQNLHKWSPFPDNCWVGCSATNEREAVSGAGNYLHAVDATVKFLSIEPLLLWDTSKFVYSLEDSLKTINWLIVGQQTPMSKKTEPKIKWIQEIVEAADKADVPVFLKDNLNSLIPFVEWNDFKSEGALRTRSGKLRQEFPILKRI